MKFTLVFLSFISLLNITGHSQDLSPYTLNNSLYAVESTEVYVGDSLNIAALHAEDLILESNFPRAGVIAETDLNLNNSGTWFDLPNGDKLWRMILKVPNAHAVSVYFSEFTIPFGATLHAYSPKYVEILPTFTFDNNPERGYYATDYVRGEVMILEYLEPKGTQGTAKVVINGLNGFYKMIPSLEEERFEENDRAGTCQVDVSCSEGDDWRRQIDGVVRITVTSNGSSGFCSGSLVNNTAEDCKPYILSAHHCATNDNDINATTSDFQQWIFRFNYQHKSCTSPLIIGSYSKTGCVKLANSTNNGGILGSDYLLVELTEALDETRTPYFNGWDATSSASDNGVSIHHPAGDEKKISTYDETLTSSNWSTSPNGSHWRVKWIATANGHGVSEGGSSGSPIFNEEKLIVGQLSGGLSECADVNPNGQTLPDLFGKMSYNWSGSANVQLISTFLDPVGNGTTKVMEGNYYLCSQGAGTVNSITEHQELESVSVYPNPAQKQFSIAIETTENIDVIIFNQVGKEVVRFNNYEVNSPINISYLSSGLYYVRVGENGIFTTKKLVVE
ncbi:MAG: T9SS type A sorting domain-containing protein [Crocinitomicaceae bacterium]